VYVCQPRNGADFSNDFFSPSQLKSVQPCFKLQGNGFCTSNSDKADAKQACYKKGSSAKMCGDVGDCVWWDLLDKANTFFDPSHPEQLQHLEEEYGLASGKSELGFYCNAGDGQGYSRVVLAQGGHDATFENCIAQLSNHAVRDVRWDQKNHVCMSLQDGIDPCLDFNTPCTPNPNVLANCKDVSCPAPVGFTCTTDGQIVPAPKPKTYKCSVNGQCVEYGVDSWDDPAKQGKYTDGICNHECFVPSKKNIDVYAPCYSFDGDDKSCGHVFRGKFRKGADVVCTNFQTGQPTHPEYPFDHSLLLDTAHNQWSCIPELDGNGDPIQDGANPKCGCTATTSNCTSLLDADRMHLQSDSTCFLPSK